MAKNGTKFISSSADMKILITILYWLLSMLIAALVVMSTGYSFQESVFMGSMFLPGAIAAKNLLPKVSFKKRSEGILGVIYIVLAILIIEYLLLFVANSVIGNYKHMHKIVMGYNHMHYEYNLNLMPSLMVNPLFISILISVLAIGGSLIDRWFAKAHPEMETPVTFCSERKKVTLMPSEIMYVESCDTEVYIHAADGRTLRNRTAISQWESLLGEQFIRIHRAFLVNSRYVKSYNQDTVSVGEETLPVSRKYQKELKDLL